MSVDVLNESGMRVGEREVLDAATYVLQEMHLHPRTDVAVRFVDEQAMSVLHEQWMDLAGPTDVMSFPMDELGPGRPDATTPAGNLGDVVICPQVAHRQAQEAGHAPEDEILLLLTHGMLHLLGFDHDSTQAETTMFDHQRRLLLGFLATRGRGDSSAPDSAASRAAAARAIGEERVDPA